MSEAHSIARKLEAVTPATSKPRTLRITQEQAERFAESVSVLLGEPDEDVVWVVEHLFAACAHGWIGAEPKVGKSWLGLELALCAALGLPFLGHAVPHPVRVLYVQEEDSKRRVRRRLRQLLIGRGLNSEAPPEALGTNLRVAIRKGFKIDHDESREWLAREMAAFKPDIIIVDVLNEVHSAKEKDQDGMSPILQHFTELEREHGGAFIILHHFAKGDGKTTRRGGQSMRGSSALHGWAENSLYLFYLRKNRFLVEPESKDEAGAEEFEVEISDSANGGVQLVRHAAQSKQEHSGEQFEKMKREAFIQKDEITVSDAATAMGCGKKTASNRLFAWVGEGRLKHRNAPEGGKKGTHYFRLPTTVVDAEGDDEVEVGR